MPASDLELAVARPSECHFKYRAVAKPVFIVTDWNALILIYRRIKVYVRILNWEVLYARKIESVGLTLVRHEGDFHNFLSVIE
jgi:hypothetical protein